MKKCDTHAQRQFWRTNFSDDGFHPIKKNDRNTFELYCKVLSDWLSPKFKQSFERQNWKKVCHCKSMHFAIYFKPLTLREDWIGELYKQEDDSSCSEAAAAGPSSCCPSGRCCCVGAAVAEGNGLFWLATQGRDGLHNRGQPFWTGGVGDSVDWRCGCQSTGSAA